MWSAMLKPERGFHQPCFHSNMAGSMRKAKSIFKYSELYYVCIDHFWLCKSILSLRFPILVLKICTISRASWHPRAQLYLAVLYDFFII